ncbi:MAG: ArsR family transcriptional regulator, arsenate/arsenite/antimonite-responsive transcriptional [Acidimicrobiaceae bacterium]|nr:ArsR family transcriptional regulator, arsenate/arsenite/antimonite-responsive transcriptional [Acidimicrobiaceae bacterium]
MFLPIGKRRSDEKNRAEPGRDGAVDAMTIEECCSPFTAEVLGGPEAEELAAAFKALADPIRLRLLSMIANTDEACACDLTAPLGRSQPTISHHMALLTEAGLVTREKRGKWAYYRIVPERLAFLREALAVPAAAR